MSTTLGITPNLESQLAHVDGEARRKIKTRVRAKVGHPFRIER